jgi:hypothetical protein
MHFPKQWWGFPQTPLLLIFAGGFFLLVWSLWSLRAKREVETLKDENGHKYHRYRHVRHFRPGRGVGGIVLMVVALFFILVAGAIEGYLGLTGKILVAHVRATQARSQGNIPVMSVDLTLYDDNGNIASHDVYIVNGDEAFIGGDIIQLPGWLNILGFHSGYKLTKLEGMYSDVDLERTQPHTVVVLNGGDDETFNDAYHKGLTSLFVTSAYKNGSSVPTNGVGYNICVSQDAIVPQPDSVPC